MMGIPLNSFIMRLSSPCLKSPALMFFAIFSLLQNISYTGLAMMITRSAFPAASCTAVMSSESVDRIVLAAGV